MNTLTTSSAQKEETPTIPLDKKSVQELTPCSTMQNGWVEIFRMTPVEIKKYSREMMVEKVTSGSGSSYNSNRWTLLAVYVNIQSGGMTLLLGKEK